ncbi:GPI mannosyltransferase 3 isoform X3 [Ipomoea triloba]|uniref:GPI mannosyltransferase 3 isoform X1 n=1 Tax=Ipomoea triloba TaxID=35885 RepID=UPI00125D2C1B|nr:GPI mannosyltransferase 3 isoform X1 [Ipomoea triloba]XP_031128011.1 GPI mannosyltransferase 3 isoform X1 [Ipomoea triloba]XP_031128012.1 GPI mannosyltransferase 3 isoform X1 [Ipomoea triloba]XP_031128013.1 GPI mannosyltransferase 3 isoform X2 [Ipomoea triloba]XP_031128014.1 GPI mannosyltransferase 3 isoform X3 [Ipomoea triloba]
MRQRKHPPTIPLESNTAQKPNPKRDSKTQALLTSSREVFILCLVARSINSLMVQTYFNPDEHWQALEVAHHITFGYGHLTWEWKKGIRSYLHPSIFALLYKILTFLKLDSPWFMIRAPRLLQSVFSAVGDLYMYKLSRVLFDDHVAKLALFAQLTNWFMFFSFTRTLSNSLETVLTLVSLYYWPCIRKSSKTTSLGSRKWALAVAALACAIRPTSAITWLYVGLLELYLTDEKIVFILLEVIPIGTLVLGVTLVLDRWMYGTWVLVPLNFLKFNFLSSGGDYYGTHVWHWYLSQGFTVMLFTFLPFSLAGIAMSKQWKLSGLIAWVLGIYSLLGHKEFRFVLPILPIALMFSGYSLARIGVPSRFSRTSYSCLSQKHLAIVFLLITNLPMALYMSTVHQRGTEDVMNYLSVEAVDGNVRNILFLTPCHATPYYSTLHRNLPMRFLDCTLSEEKGMLDESDRFMLDPVGFATEFAKNWSLPSHIVVFDAQEKLLKDFMVSHNFMEVKRFFHAHFKVDRELQSSIAVYASKG